MKRGAPTSGLAASFGSAAEAPRPASTTTAASPASTAARLTRVTAPEAGHVAHKNVAVGDYVEVGQNLMALVPLEVWVTANFKETQLAGVRDGQKAEVKADLSGVTYRGHVDSIAAATGTRMSLLPPENATGNFVKIVQRLPVRVELTDYDPDKTKAPLFVGLSCTPYVYYKEPATGPHAGEFLQPVATLPNIGLNP